MKYKTYGKGWHFESHRHSLAARGIKTKTGDSLKKGYFDKVVGFCSKEELDYLRDVYDMEPWEIPVDEARQAIEEYREVKARERVKRKSMAERFSRLNFQVKMIDFSNDNVYRRFKKAYLKAKEEGKDRFEFNGQPVLLTYAKYLLEYVENKRRLMGLKIYKKDER